MENKITIYINLLHKPTVHLYHECQTGNEKSCSFSIWITVDHCLLHVHSNWVNHKKYTKDMARSYHFRPIICRSNYEASFILRPVPILFQPSSPSLIQISVMTMNGNFGLPDADQRVLNPLNPELNPICYLLALLGAHHFLHVSRIRVKLLTFRLLVSYTYGAPILDVSRSHTTTQHSR